MKKNVTKHLDGYLGEFPAMPLSREEEYRLVMMAQTGNGEARDTLLIYSIDAIHRIARKYCAPNDPRFASLVNSGVLALIKAIPDFDIQRGYRLSTYANAHIKKDILSEIQKECHSVELSTTTLEELRAIWREENASQEKGECFPSSAMLAARLDIPIEHVWICQHYRNRLSLDQENVELIPDPGPMVENKGNILMLQYLLTHTDLDQRERLILDLHYGQNLELKEIAVTLQRTRERVCQIEAGALRKLLACAQTTQRLSIDNHMLYLYNT